MGNQNSTPTPAPQIENGVILRESKNGRQFKLTPITFDEFGREVNSFKLQTNLFDKTSTPTVTSKFRGGSRFQHDRKAATTVDTALQVGNLRDIYASPYENGEGQMTIPFSVVKLSLEKELLEVIEKLNPDLLDRYERNFKATRQSWKVNSKGYYFRRLDNDRIVIVKPGNFYEGSYLAVKEQIVPHGEGLLVTKKGMYKGSFYKGQANGKGTYFDYKMKTKCQGEWIAGEISHGSLSSDWFLYDGDFVNSVAHGQGNIELKYKHSSYRGQFVEGKYQDQNGYFSSDDYDYSGGFKEGRKHGIGCLIEKQRYLQSRSNKKKYRPQEELEGYFNNDCYVGKKKMVDVSRLA